MKKFVYFIFASIFPLGVYAQDIPVDSSNMNKVDSLTQVVNELSSKIQKVEDDKHNESIWENRRKYFNFGYMNQTLTHQDVPGLEWKSDFGFSLGRGRTYYLHKKPLFNMLKFGLDATLFDISYAKYSQPKGWEEPSESTELDDKEDLGMHQVETGLHVGPSITINPVDHLKLNGYFHFIPSGSMIILNDEAYTSYVSNFAVGAAISYKAISSGIESRWGEAKYNPFSVNEEATDMKGNHDVDDVFVTGKNRMKTKSLRFFLTFHF